MPTWSVTTPALSDDLVSLARVEAELGIIDVAQSATLALWITEASLRVASWALAEPDAAGKVSLAAVAASATWLASEVPDSAILYLPWRPPVTISGVTVGGVALASSAYRANAAACSIIRIDDGALASWEAEDTVVSFTGGVAAGGQADLARAVIEMVRRQYHASSRDPALKAYEIDGVIRREFWVQSGSVDAGVMPADLAGQIARWRAPHRPVVFEAG